MPSKPAFSGLVKHQVMQWLHNEVAVWTVWTRRAGVPPTQARIDQERLILRGWLTDERAQLCSVFNWVFQIKSWDFSVSPPAKYPDNDITPNIQGTRSGAGATPLPNQLSVVVSLRSQPVGASVKGHNGRLYHPSLVATDLAGAAEPGPSFVKASFAAELDAGYEILRTQLTGQTLAGTWVIYSVQENNAPVFMTYDVDHVLVNPRVDVMRSRAPRQQSYPLGS